MLIVGLTGNAASGKSSVAQLMAARGATIVDADVLARIAVEPGSPGLKAIVEHWGPGILTPDGSLDRETMRHRVFANPKELEALNAIVHPAVARLRDQAIAVARTQGARIVICDIPLLFETGAQDRVDAVVVVTAPAEIQRARAFQRADMTDDKFQALLRRQLPDADKRRRADFVVDTSGGFDSARAQVRAIVEAARALPIRRRSGGG